MELLGAERAASARVLVLRPGQQAEKNLKGTKELFEFGGICRTDPNHTLLLSTGAA